MNGQADLKQNNMNPMNSVGKKTKQTFIRTFLGGLFLVAFSFIPFSTWGQCSVNAGPDVSICSGGSVQLNATFTGNAGGATNYSWSPATGLSATNIPNPVASPTTTTTYTVTATVTGGSCPDTTYTDQVTVTVNPNPTANFTAADNVCANLSVQFTNTSTGNNLSYSWNFDDPGSGANNTSTAANPLHTFQTDIIGCGTKSYNVNLTVTDANGCTASTNKTVTVKKLPEASLSHVNAISVPFQQCSATPSNFYVEVSPSGTICPTSVYSINWGDGATYGPNSSGATNHTYTGMGSWSLTYTVSNNGCSNTTTYNVFNGTNPTFNFSLPSGTQTTGCAPFTLPFQVVNWQSNTNDTQYQFDPGDNSGVLTYSQSNMVSLIPYTFTQSSSNTQFNWNSQQYYNAYLVKLTATNNCGIYQETIYPIKVNKAPQASFTTNLSQNMGCVNTPVSFTNTSQVGAWITGTTSPQQVGRKSTFVWEFGDGTKQTLPNIEPEQIGTAGSATHTYSSPGVYVVKLKAANFGTETCDTTLYENTICINPSVTTANVGFNVDVTEGCRPLVVTTTNTSTVPNTCGNLTYNWTVTYSNTGNCGSGTGSWIFESGSASSSAPKFRFNDAGTYTLKLTVSNNCGSAYYERQITVKDKPQVSVASLPDICAGESVTPTATFNTCYGPITAYNWNMPGGTPSSSNQANPGSVVYNSAGTFTITASATNACGTTNSSTNLTVKPRPTPSITSGPSSVCINSTTTYETQSGMTGYTWSVTSGVINSGSGTNSISVTWTTVGNGSVSVNFTNANGCPAQSPTVFPVTVNPLPVVTLSGTTEVCVGGTGTYTTESGMSNYLWQVSPGGIITTPNPSTSHTITVQWTQSGTGWVKVNYDDGNGCSAAQPTQLTVNVWSLPTPAILTGPASVCHNQTAQYTTTSGMSNYSWSLNPPSAGTLTGANTATVSVQWNNTGTQNITATLTVSYTDNHGCTGTGSGMQITIKPRPTATATPQSQEICSGSNFTPIQLSSNISGTTFTWSGSTTGGISLPSGLQNGSGNPIQSNSSLTNTNNTLETVTFNITPTADGCSGNQIQATIGVKPLPQLTFNPTTHDPICSGSSTNPITFNSNLSNTTYSLTVSNPSSVNGVLSAGPVSALPSHTLTLPSPGTTQATVTYTVTPSASGCNGTPQSISIQVNPLGIVGNTVLEKTICSGEQVGITLVPGGSASTQFSWTASLYSGSASGFSNGSGTTINDIINNTGNGAAVVKYTVTPTLNGCQGTPKVFTVTILPSPSITFTPSSPQVICAGSTTPSIQLSTSTTGYTVNYSWQASASSPSVTMSTQTGGPGQVPGTIQPFTINSTSNNVETVTITVSASVGSCPSVPYTYNITVNPSPGVIFNPQTPQSLCSGASTQPIQLTSNVSGVSFQWNAQASSPNVQNFITSGNQASIPSQQPTNSGNTNETITYSVSAIYSGGGFSCPGQTQTYQITVKPLPQISSVTPQSQTKCPGSNSEPINFQSTVSGTTYQWTGSASGTILPSGFQTGTQNPIPSISNLTNTGTSPATITFNITPSAQGCIGSAAEATITINPSPTISLSPATHPAICSGESTQQISISSNLGNTNYTLSSTATPNNIQGVASSLSGNNIPSHTLTLPAAYYQSGTVTYTITPTTNGCQGAPASIGIQVKPLGDISNTQLTKTICSGQNVSINLTSNVSGTNFSWTATLVSGSISGFNSGSGTQINDILVNNGTAAGQVKYTVVPNASNCQGASKEFVVTVKPKPDVLFSPVNQTICAGTQFQDIQLSTSIVGEAVQYTWTGTAPTGISNYPPQGNTPVINGTIVNSTLSTQGAITYTVVPNISGCNYTDSYTTTVSVNPSPGVQTATPASPQAICSGTTSQEVILTGTVQGTTFDWTATSNNPSVSGFTTSGSGNIPPQTIVNSSNTTATVTYHIVPNSTQSGVSCAGVPQDYIITVNPLPDVTGTGLTQTLCSGVASQAIALSSSVTGTQFNWSVNYPQYLTPQGSTSGSTSQSISPQTWINTGTQAGQAVYSITPVFNNCQGNPVSALLTVQPVAQVVTSPSSYEVCSGTAVNIPLNSNVSSGVTYSWEVTVVNGSSVTGYQSQSQPGVFSAITQTIYNEGNTNATLRYRIYAWVGDCSGPYTDVMVTVKPNPVVTTSGPYDICSGQTTNIPLQSNVNGAQFTWTYNASSFVSGASNQNTPTTGSIQQTLSIPEQTPGLVTYIVEATAGGCQGPVKNIVVNVNPNPVANAGNDQTVNYGTPVTLSGINSNGGTGTLSYAWSPCDPPIIPPCNTTTVTTTNLTQTTTFTLVVTDTKQCSSTAQVTISVQGNPVAVTANADPAVVCFSSSLSITLSAQASGGAGGNNPNYPYSFSWSQVSPTGSWTATGATVTVSPETAGTYVYKVIASDEFGNQSNANVTVVVNPLPQIFDVSATNNGFYCSDGSGVSLTLSGSQTGVSYQLNYNGSPSGNPVSGTGSSLTFPGLFSQLGAYTVLATNTSTQCQQTMNGSIQVQTWTLPNATASANPAVIPNGAWTTLTATATGGLTPYTWQWMECNLINQSIHPCTNSEVRTANLSSSVTYHVIVTDAHGCDDTASVFVDVSGNPLALSCSSTPDVVCNDGSSVNLAALATGGNTLGYQYSWTGPSGWTSNAPNPVYTPTTAGLHSFTVSVNDGYNTVTCNTSLTVNPLPTVYNVEGGGGYCAGGTGKLITLSGSQSNPPTTYQLYFNGSPVGNPKNGTGAAISFGPYTEAGVYTIKATHLATGCEQWMNGEATIVIWSNPIADAGIDIVINGYNMPAVLTGNASGGTEPYSRFEWLPQNKINGANFQNNPTGTSFQVNTVQLTNPVNEFYFKVIDANNCMATDTVVVSVLGQQLQGTISATPDVICNDGSSIQLNATASNGSGGPYTFTWSSNPSGPAIPSIPNPIVNPTQNTQYIVTISDGYSSIQLSVNVTVNPLPQVYQVIGGGEYCAGGQGLPVGINGSQQGILYTLFRDNISTNLTQTGNGAALSFGNQTLPGTYTVLAQNTTTGCQSPMNGNVGISVNPLPVASAMAPNSPINHGISTDLVGSASQGTAPYTYQWQPVNKIASGATSTNAQTTNLYANQWYSFIVTDSKQCKDTADVLVEVQGDPLTVVAVAQPDTICAGQEVQLSATGMGGNLVYTYTWKQGNTVIANTQVVNVSPSATTTYTVIVDDGYNTASATATVVVNPVPLQFNVLGGGEYCAGGQGVQVILESSQPGIQYELIRDGQLTGQVMMGSAGAPVNFGYQTLAGDYTVMATDPSSACSVMMNGTATVVVNPLPLVYAVTGGGSYPSGGIGVPVGLNGSQTGINYMLLINGVPSLPTPGIAGDGNPIDFGLQTQAGNYTVLATNPVTGCENMMQGAVTVTINPYPNQMNVIGGGPICEGDEGAMVGLDDSEVGVRYILYRNNDSIADALGTGDTLLWGPYPVAGTYTVKGINLSNGLEKMMNGQAVIVVNPNPLPFSLVPSGIQCQGTQLYISGSEAGVYYVTYRWNSAIDTVYGTGLWALLPVYLANDTGLYHVAAVNMLTGCRTDLDDSARVVLSPAVFQMHPIGILCEGENIWIEGSQPGILYQLRRDGNYNVGPPLPGTGGALSFGSVHYPGVYKVLAINPITLCTSWMKDSAVLYPAPIQFALTPHGDSCAPVELGLSGSQVGYTYELYNNSYFPPLSTVTGTGQPLSFGLQNLSGTYKVRAINQLTQCASWMHDSITLYPRPIAYDVVPTGPVCPGTTITLENSQTGVLYQLLKDYMYQLGSPVAGTGAPLPIGVAQQEGTYNVIAWYPDTQCSELMNGTVEVLPAPAIYTITPPGTHCAGTVVGISGTQQGFEYRLIRNNLMSTPVAIIYGNGSMMNFGPMYLPGTYKVAAFDPVASCTQWMLDSVVIIQSPQVFTLLPAGANCEPTNVMLSGSEMGVSYELLKNGQSMSPPVIIAGTGNMISFGMQMGGTYTARAIAGSLNCESMMNGTVEVTPMPVVNLGNDTLLCSNTVYQASPLVAGYSSMQWSTSGDGTFNNISIPNAIYTPGPGDLSSGSVVLTLSLNGTPECPSVVVSDQITLNFHPLPLANAGPDLTGCEGLPATLTGTGLNYSQVMWTTSGDGFFSSPASETTDYLPGPADRAAGQVTLTFTVWGSQACSTTTHSDDMLLTLQPLPVAIAGPDTTICESNMAYVHGSALYAGNVPQWITTGDGIFNNPSAWKTTYTPGTQDKLTGMVHLVLKVTGVNTCASQFATDTLTLTIQRLPFINLGPDLTVCANTPAVDLSAQVTNYSVLNWETTGFGTFQPNGGLTTAYQVNPSDTVAGNILVLLRAWGTGQCINGTQTDTLQLFFDPLPEVIAGADTFSCDGAPVRVSVRAMHVSGVYWETRGNGIFDDRTSLNPVYTPGSFDMGAGGVWLVVKGFGAATCMGTLDTDSLYVEIKPLPSAIISGVDTICRGQQAQFTLQLTGTPPWTVEVSNGLNSWTFSNIQTPVYQASVSPIVTTSYFITSVQDAFCSGTQMTGLATVYVNPNPTLFTLSASGNGFFCPGSQGCELTLNGSQQGIVYQLMRGGEPLGQPVTGTGYPLSFGWFNLPGNYYVIATNPATGCQAQMNGIIFLIMTPEPDVDFSSGTACHNQPVQFTLSGNSVQEIVSFEWNFGDGNTAVYLNAVNPTHVYQAPGTYWVTLTVTNIFGCQSSILHPIEVHVLPVSLFAAEAGTCLGTPVSFVNYSYSQQPSYILSSLWNFGDGQTQLLNWPASQNTTHVYGNTGTYNVTLTVTNSVGCQSSSSQLIAINSGPSAAFAAGNACGDMVVTFTDFSQPAQGTQLIGWLWDFGDPASGINNTSTLQNPQHTYAQPGTYPVRLIVYSSDGCQDTVIQNVNVNPAPVASFNATTACSGLATQFTDASSGSGVPITSWLWDFGDGTGTSNLQNPVHTYSSPGTWMVTLTVTNANGCVGSITQPIIVIPGPTASFVMIAQACVGSEVSFHDQSTTLIGYITQWIWDFGDGTSQTVNFPASPHVTHVYNLTGTYQVTLTVISSTGCQHFTTQTLVIQNGPVAAFQESPVKCQNSPVDFTDQSLASGGAPIVSWLWNFGDPASGIYNTSSVQHPQHTFALPGTYSVKLIIQNAIGCIDSTTKLINIKPQPTSFFQADTVCLGDTTLFVDQSTANAGLLTYWSWNFGDGSVGSILQNPVHLYAAPGTYYPTLTVTNSYGCVNDTSLPVYVRTLPQAAFVVSSTNCHGLPVHFTNQSTFTEGYITQWHWIFGDGEDTTINFPAVPDVDHIYPFTGTYLAQLEVTTNHGCNSEASQLVNVVASPVADFTTGASTCASQAVQFYDQSATPGNIPTVSWLWDFGDPASGIYNTSTQQNPLHIFTGTSTYNVKLIITNLNGCSDTIIKPVVISPAPLAQFTADTACLGTPTHFTDLSITPVGNIISWLWNFGDGFTSNLQNPEHTYVNWGVYNVSLTVTNSNGCQHDTTLSVQVNPVPAVAFTFSNTCAQSPTQFTDLSVSPQGNISQWLWNFGDGQTSTQQNPVHTYATGGSYIVSLTVTNTQGCSHTSEQTVHIFNPPTAGFAYNSVYCPAGQVSFQDLTVGNGSPVTWRNWDFGNGNFSTTANPVYVYPLVDSCYNVTLTVGNASGCTDTTSQVVCVKPAFGFTFDADASCTGRPTLFRPLIQAQGDTLLFVEWSFGDPASGTLNQSTSYYAQHTYTKAGIYGVKLKAWNSDYCVDSVYKYITVLDPPVADFTWQSQTPHCDTTITFTHLTLTQGAPIDSLIWQFGDGTQLVQYNPVPPAVTHHFPAFGTYQVTLSAYVSNHCSDQVSKQVKVKCLSADFAFDTAACQNVGVTFNDLSGPVLSITKWLWLFGDGMYEEYTSWKPSVSHTFNQAGIYNVKLITQGVINGLPVQDSITYPVVVWPAPVAAFSAGNLCMGDTVRFVNQSWVMLDSIAENHWWFGDGRTSTAWEPGHRYNSPDTSFNVRLSVVSRHGCMDITESLIVLKPSPVIDILPKNGLFCGDGYKVNFLENSGNTYTDYLWIWGDGDTLLTHTASAPHVYAEGEYSIKLSVMNENGCHAVDSTRVRIKPAPTAGIWVDKYRAPFNEPRFRFEDNSQSPLSPIVQWNWLIDDNLQLYSGSGFEGDLHKMLIHSGNNQYSVVDTGYHKVSLVVTNLEGCTDTAAVNIYLEPVLIITAPNAFTPNHDNLNNTFKPHLLNIRKENYHLRIYNRWGQMVFETTNPDEAWDGSYKNEPCPPGTYIWMVEYLDFNGKPENRKGAVTLLR